MGRHEGDDKRKAPTSEPRQALVYIPCPACGRTVHLSDATRVFDDPETYECPHCGARFYLTDGTVSP
jgi:predicted RNA-binding Zn-ribbon protein involved in translation (DUF1610 family)